MSKNRKSESKPTLGPKWGEFAGAELCQEEHSTLLVNGRKVAVVESTFINGEGKKLHIGGLNHNLETGESYVERFENDGTLIIPLGVFTEEERLANIRWVDR